MGPACVLCFCECHEPQFLPVPSMTNPSVDDIPYLVAIALTVAALIVIYFATGHDRSRRGGVTRRRCPGCWYAIIDGPGCVNGTKNSRCPECGRRIRSERDLLRTRRHRRLLAVGVLCLGLAVVAGLVPKARRDGVPSIMPTTILVLMPMDAHEWFTSKPAPTSRTPTMRQELRRRMRGDRLAPWQERVLLARIGSAARRHDLTWIRGAADALDPDVTRFAVHEIDDLATDADSVETIRDFVLEFIDPEGWRDQGGNDGVIETLDGRLAVDHLPANHEAITRFLDGLRSTRMPASMPPESEMTSGILQELRDAAVATPIGANAGAAGILSQLRGRRLTTPRPADAGDAEALSVRVYRLRPGLSWWDAGRLAEQIVNDVDEDHWLDRGGNVGHIYVFRSGLAIQTRRMHFAEIEDILADWVRAPGEP